MQISGLSTGSVKASAPAAGKTGEAVNKKNFFTILHALKSNTESSATDKAPSSEESLPSTLADLLKMLRNMLEARSGTEEQGELKIGGLKEILTLLSSNPAITKDKMDGLVKWLKQEAPGSNIDKITDTDTLFSEPAEEQLAEALANMLAALLSMQHENKKASTGELKQEAAKNSSQIEFPAGTLEEAPVLNKDALVNEIKKLLSSTAEQEEKNKYLHNTFTRLVSELNQENAKKENFPVNPSSSGNGNLTALGGTFTLPHHITNAEKITLMLQPDGKPITTEQLFKQFEAILSKSQILKTGGTQKLLVNLTPENLGSLRIELTQRDQTITARILTTTGAAKEALESHLNGLKQAFAVQNIQVERVEIAQQFSQMERFFNRDHQQQSNGQQRQKQPEDEKKRENEKDFTVSFEQALVNMEA